MTAEVVPTVIDGSVAPTLIEAEVVPAVVQVTIDPSHTGRPGPEAEVPVPFNREGPLTVTVGAQGYPVPYACTVLGVRGWLRVAPTGADAIFDVNANGVTIFGNQTLRPRAVDGSQTVPEAAGMTVTALSAGDVLSVDIDQIGSTLAGSDLTLTIRIRKA